MCIAHAKKLELKPVVSKLCRDLDGWQVGEKPYEGVASSKGSRCPWDYVDSARGHLSGAEYTVKDLYSVKEDQ